MSTKRSPSTENKILAMTVSNIGFLLDRLGQDCHRLQFLRELTQNSIEAIERTGNPGTIIWDVDWVTYDLEGHKKLAIIDTGDGMTGEEMVRFINQLSSSYTSQSLTGNYGVGAKIAAATKNHEGVVYLSWKDGEGSMIHLRRDPVTGQYGLLRWEREDGLYSDYMPIEDDVKPDEIDDHGTMVVLLGNSPEDKTVDAPDGAPSPSRWVSKYLNSRYYSFPENITIKAREGWDYSRDDQDRNYLRTLIGQEQYLSDHSSQSGEVSLKGARAKWWILKDEPALTSNSGYIESSGHVAALYHNELYEVTAGRRGMSLLQQFGITFGYRYVVIYLEPLPKDDQSLTTNTARTALLIDNDSLPWGDWAEEFRKKLPDRLDEFVRSKSEQATSKDHSSAIRDRLKSLMTLFKVTRYRPTPGGQVSVDDEVRDVGGTSQPLQGGSGGGRGGSSGGKGGRGGNIYSVFEKKGGEPAEQVQPDLFPQIRWVSVTEGTRETGDIEDRAAKFLADQNLLLINADFRVFTDMIDFFSNQWDGQAGVEGMITEAVRGWFEQALVETILGVRALRNSKEWNSKQIDSALSEEALTTAVMQRYHVHFAVKRELGSKLGAGRQKKAS